MIKGTKKYERKISRQKLTFYRGNLDYMERSLNMFLGAFDFRDIISFYLLISYLRKKRAGNQNLQNEYAVFARIFMQKLNMFSIYDIKPPKGMTKEEFERIRSISKNQRS